MTSPSALTDLPAMCGGRPLFPQPLRFVQPTLPPLETVFRRYETVYSQGMITNGALVENLEREVAERLGVAHCVAVSSCTSGLLLVLRALGLTGEVILPSFTFFATGHAVLWNHLRPVFADCERDTWTIDVGDVERRITSRTSAILAVHVYGNPCAIEELSRVAACYRLKLIFDSAHAFGSYYHGVPVGRFGDAEVFSLSPTKTLVSGEGGLVTTNDAILARRLRALRNYGDSGNYDCKVLGLNARMQEFSAALALAGLDSTEEKVRAHNSIAAKYTTGLSTVPGLSFQSVRDRCVSTFKDYSACVNAAGFGAARDQLVTHLAAENISTRKYFSPALHQQILYKEWASREPFDGLKTTECVSGGIVSLPIYRSLEDRTISGIVDAIRRLAAYYHAKAG
jgi:dTDP-4-amino-4,6-dideoxygalactose transaminase